MFRDLYAVARHTPLHLIITPNGEQLKIIVTPKPTGDAADNPALAKPFSAIGTPEELDREFPEALKKYAGAVNDLRTSIDLPLSELEEAKKKATKKDEKKAERERLKKEEEERRSASAKKAAETRAQKAAEAKAEKERKAKAKADAKAAKKAGKGAPAAKIGMPGAAAGAPIWPFPIGKSPEEVAVQAKYGTTEAERIINGLPGKPECLADYRQMKLKHGDKLTRRLFIKKGKTGRRYEKLWKNWEAFLKDATAQAELPLEQAQDTGPAASTARQQGSEGDQGTTAAAAGANAIEGSNPSGSTTSAAAPVVSNDTSSSLANPATAADPKPATLAVLDRKTKRLLGTYTGDAKAGDTIRLNDQAEAYLVDAIVPGVEIHAHRVHESPWSVFNETGATLAYTHEIQSAGERLDQAACTCAPGFSFDNDGLIVHEVHEHDRAYTVKSARPKFLVYDDDDVLVAEFKWPPQLGERLQVDEFPHAFLVEAVDGQRVTARRVLKAKKQIVDDGGNRLGETDEIYDIADQVAELADKEWRVVKSDGAAYTVKAAKPRLKGPVAAAATLTE